MSSNRKIQILPPEAEYSCDACGERVAFRVVATRPVGGDDEHMIAYLECPLCHNRARQVRWKRRKNTESVCRQNENPAEK